MARILYEGFRFSGKRTQYFMKKTKKGEQEEPVELATGLRRMSGL
jgi:hypothetical protein